MVSHSFKLMFVSLVRNSVLKVLFETLRLMSVGKGDRGTRAHYLSTFVGFLTPCLLGRFWDGPNLVKRMLLF